MRFRNIDLLKGLLIILVIVGHVLQGKLSESIWRYFIYAFHMPLFISIGGFLLNFQKLKELSLSNLLWKYVERIIIP
ncbi:acyltransferase family protein [Desertivirga xinjiangensis]|uniref:acyltransferase family protein n=1 Tax=Desertivirga xinjiangensis TaxID=539206 RepID=UPI0034E2BADD